jgi:hypothetical protein
VSGTLAVAGVVLEFATVTMALLRVILWWYRESGAIVVEAAESKSIRDGAAVCSSTALGFTEGQAVTNGARAAATCTCTWCAMCA